MKHSLSTLAATLGCALLLAGCSKPADSGAESGDLADEWQPLTGVTHDNTPVPVPDLTEAARDPRYTQAIRDATLLLGARPQPFENEEGPVPGGYTFAVPHEKAESLLRKAHTDFLAKGCYLFRHEQSFGFGGQPDQFVLLPTTNKFDVMAIVAVNGANYDLYTAGIIQWMKQLEQEQPYVLTGIGFDYMEGYFTTPIQDPRGLARRMYSFCPDIVDQGTETVDKLASELKKGELYFWWD